MIIALERIRSSARPIRNEKDEEKLQQLVDSMKEQGRCIVPIKVRPVKDEADVFEVIFGNRRLEAARRLQWNEIDCIIEEVTDENALVQEMIENVVREDMAPIDTAKALKRLMEETGWSMQEVGRRGIMDVSSVSRSIKLLELPIDVQALVGKVGIGGEVEEGKISAKHVRAIEGMAVGPDNTPKILKKAADEGLTADQTRQIARNVSMMKADEAEAYLARPGVNTSKETVAPPEKETNPDVLEYIELMKQYFTATNDLARAIRDEEIEITEKAATYIYRQTGLMYGVWDNLRNVVKHSQPQEITE
jgi:ParB family transcriptional regulator, chromosome partitioning protein